MEEAQVSVLITVAASVWFALGFWGLVDYATSLKGSHSRVRFGDCLSGIAILMAGPVRLIWRK
jgi:hypothetical protein